MIKGHIINNTGRSRHIFKRTVYPGQKVSLEDVYFLVKDKFSDSSGFMEWLEERLPEGWEVFVAPQAENSAVGGRMYKEVLTAVPTVENAPADEDAVVDSRASLEYITPKAIDKLTARDIYRLRLKDNPKRIIKQITSIHKLRRALALCKNDSRKATLTRLIQGRIRELNVTL